MNLNRNANFTDWYDDIRIMHRKFGAKQWVTRQFEARNFKLLNDFLAFRLDFLEEEFEETQEVVDGLIDLIVIAIGTLELFNCDADRVWREIYKSNMAKEPGANKSRKNPFGLPDMVKPEGWKEPEILKYDCGTLPDIFESEKERIQTLRETRDLNNELKNNIANSQYE